MKKGFKIFGIVLLALVVVGIFAPKESDDNVKDKGEIANKENIEQDSENNKEEKFSVTLNGIDMGEYGQEFILNKDTDMPTKYIAYKLPAGKYKATNLDKKYVGSLLVYTDETHIVDGWEECVGASSPETVEPGKSKEIEIHDNEHIKVIPSEEKSGFLLEKIAE